MNVERCILRALTRMHRMTEINARGVLNRVHDLCGKPRIFQHDLASAAPVVLECAAGIIEANKRSFDGLAMDLKLLCTFPHHKCPVLTQADYFGCRGNLGVLLALVGVTPTGTNRAVTVLSEIGSLVVAAGGGVIDVTIEEVVSSRSPIRVHFRAAGIEASLFEGLASSALGVRDLGRTLHGIRRLSTDVTIEDGLDVCVPLEVEVCT